MQITIAVLLSLLSFQANAFEYQVEDLNSCTQVIRQVEFKQEQVVAFKFYFESKLNVFDGTELNGFAYNWLDSSKQCKVGIQIKYPEKIQVRVLKPHRNLGFISYGDKYWKSDEQKWYYKIGTPSYGHFSAQAKSDKLKIGIFEEGFYSGNGPLSSPYYYEKGNALSDWTKCGEDNIAIDMTFQTQVRTMESDLVKLDLQKYYLELEWRQCSTHADK